ncbi:MAG TPA: AAA family ATPase [Puia sp.]|nr:AAA family ATPase [Puia sp.]
MDNTYTQKVINANVFHNYFLDAKKLYLHYFNELPGLDDITGIDAERAFAAFKEKFSASIIRIHQYRRREQNKKYEFDATLVAMNNRCLLEFNNNYCEIWHDGGHQAFIDEVHELLRRFKRRQRRQPFEINLVVNHRNAMGLKAMELKRSKLDLDLFYEDDIKEIDELIRRRLNKKDDKGIVLLHGMPGTGKTTYLRYLIGKIKKRVLFLSPGMADNLMKPDFMELLIQNPNSVVVIEDAENVLMDRKYSSYSSVSNLLNISDGLLSDALNVQLVCTFNSPLSFIDSAILRKGRLIARYEFGKLSVAKAQRLNKTLGFDTIIERPTTIAEIAGQHEKSTEMPKTETIGFRRHTPISEYTSTLKN